MKLVVLGSTEDYGLVYFPDGTYYQIFYSDWSDFLSTFITDQLKRMAFSTKGRLWLKTKARVPFYENEFKAFLKTKYGEGEKTTEGGHVSTTYTDPTGSGNSNEPNVPFVPEQSSSQIGKMALMGLGLFALYKITLPKNGKKTKSKRRR